MSDIAQLGLAVDSSQVNAATAALKNFQAAAAPASDAAAALEKAAADASPAMAGVGKASDATQTSLRNQREAIRGIATDLTFLSGGLGQYALIAGTLYYDNQKLLEGYGGLKNALGALLTPTNLLIGATVGLTVAGAAWVESVLQQEKALDDLSVRTDTTIAKLHALDAAASFKGIDTPDFLKQMTQFGALTEDATHNMGSLAELFRANGVQAGTLEQNMLSVADLVKNAGSEAAKYNIIQEAGLPATRQWVDFLSQGAAGIRNAEAAATQFNGTAAKQLVDSAREFEEKWDTAWKNFKDGADSALLGFIGYAEKAAQSPFFHALITAVPVLGTMVQVFDVLSKQSPAQLVNNAFNAAGNYTNPALAKALANMTGTKAPNTTVDYKYLQNNLALEQQSLSVLGPLATVSDQVREKQISLQQAILAGVPITKQAENAILSYTEKEALGVIAIQQQTSAQQIQAATVGMSIGAATAYAAVQERINAAAIVGNTLKPNEIAQLQKYATELGDAAQRAALLKAQSDVLFARMQLGNDQVEQQVATTLHNLYGDDYQQHLNDAIANQIRFNAVMSQTKQITEDALTTFVQDMAHGKSAVDALRDALGNVEDQLIKIASNKLASSLMGNSLGNLLGGLLGGSAPVGGIDPGLLAETAHTGGILGADRLPGRYVHPTYFDDAPRFHSGGMVSDEVPIIARKGEGVFTPEQMKALAPVGASGPQITINNYNTFTNADPSSEARLKSYVDMRSKQTVQEAVQAVGQANSTAPSYLRNGR